MKITDLKTWVVANPPPHFGGRYFIFVKLTTDSGVEGIGEIYAATFGPRVIARMAEDVFARFVAGADPFRIEILWRRVYGSGYNLRPDVSLMGVLSGLEMACWDIIGKELNKPVYELLGGRVHERLRSYTYLYPADGDPGGISGDAVYTDPDLAAARAAEYVDLGFTAVKFDPAGPYSVFDPRQPRLEDLDRCARFVEKIRAAVGVRADILFGTHGQFTAAGAIRLARRIEPWEPLWFEEPTPPDNPREMARVARQTSIPVATGERLTTKYEFARVLECGAAAILQPALGRVGGLLEAKKIAGMSEAHHAQIAPHLYCGPIEGAANIQLAACSPNFLILEGIQTWGGFYAQLLKRPVQWESGHVIPPTAPGLGVELNEEVADANPYTGDKLHLEMLDAPVSSSPSRRNPESRTRRTGAERLLQSVGVKTFVDCFAARHQRGDLSRDDVAKLCAPESSGWAKDSLAAKTSKINKIFGDNCQREALKLCCVAKRVSDETHNKANDLYKRLCS